MHNHKLNPTRRKSRSSSSAPRPANGPSPQYDHLHAKRRQHLKKHTTHGTRSIAVAAAIARQRRKESFAALQKKRERWAKMAEETRDIVLGDGKYVEERRVPRVVDSPLLMTAPNTASVPQNDFSSDIGFFTSGVSHDIYMQMQLSRQGTTFYPHYSWLLADWHLPPSNGPREFKGKTTIEFTRTSTLTATYALTVTHPDLVTTSPTSLPRTALGVLSFASPKKPGGGYLHGGNEQEEGLARCSSLVSSLSGEGGKEFYQTHRKYWKEDGSGLHDHSMLYSPGVVVIRKDDEETEVAGVLGEQSRNSRIGHPVASTSTSITKSIPPSSQSTFVSPYIINVISSVPVNAAAVRSKHTITPSEIEFFESGIRTAMKERMARILRCFEERGDRMLVLGAFGCGSSENRVESVAEIWAELLVTGDGDRESGGAEGEGEDGIVKGGARFRDVFEKVVFAVPGKTFDTFKRAFEMRVFEMELASAALED
ncbi:hypothetical protein JAAARDRAFT_37640 [Jaapia argillacea MUCL 33604]|uniref:Microbial-type PARG catalytic domain-containing protein n=1 Tax=Jaapia argillacea MUCL 33604 TaxID=933084 RepID=A0A067PV16_9AGAM|nr:hypothetical protein JAAARDRAFT_37640 [Jaapia argillacea MUCL 33604]